MYKNKEFFEQMVNEGKTLKELSDIFKVRKETIKYWEKKHNLKLKRDTSRKYIFNEDYFRDIDTEEKAYFLGLIMADGFVDKKEKLLGISLKNEDSYILEKLLSELKLESGLKSKKNDTQKVIYVCSKKLVKDLKKYSITPNKTFTIKFPRLREDLIRHFLRGYFDGDGCVGERQYWLIVSSECFLEYLIEYLEKKFCSKIYYIKENKSYKLCFCRKNYEIINYIYSDSKVYLKRKKNKYEKFWKHYN